MGLCVLCAKNGGMLPEWVSAVGGFQCHGRCQRCGYDSAIVALHVLPRMAGEANPAQEIKPDEPH